MTGLEAPRGASLAAPPVRVALVSAGEVYGGVERFISTYSRFLRESGMGAPLVALFSDGRLAEELRSARVPLWISPFGKYDPRSVGWLADLLRDEMVDVVHAHGYKAGVIGGLSAKRAGVPAVKTEHGALEPFSGVAALKMRLNLGLDAAITRLFFDETVYITADLKTAKGLAGRRGSRVIANGIAPIDKDRPVRGSSRSRMKVGIVGRLVPVKGHATLFAACAQAKRKLDIDVHVFGSGPLEESLLSQAERALPRQVTFHGFVGDVVERMAGMDCLAMPSGNEGLPYTLLEAMHLGLPIVASNVGGMKEILKDGETALLSPPGDAAALAANLDRLADDPELGRRIGAAAKAEAREKFGIEAMARSYAHLYREVLR